MKLPELKTQHYELLWIGLVSIVVLVSIIIIIKDDLFKESVIENNWEIVNDETSSPNDKIEALKYLLIQKEPVGDKINVSVAQHIFQGIDLSPKTLETQKGVGLERISLKQVNLSEVNFSSVNLSNAVLSGADLTAARLHDANLSGADLSDADLSGANLSGANLSGANLSGANLFATDLTATNLSNAVFSDANLFAVNFSAVNLSDAVLDEKTVINYSWAWRPSRKQLSEAFLPIGNPKNWNATLKPDYLCRTYSSLDEVETTKEQIKKALEKRCKPYTPPSPATEPETAETP